MSEHEIRTLATSELRALPVGKDEPMKIEGYAAVFNQTADLPDFKERIMPGAFTRSLDEGADIVCLFNHDPNLILGRTKAGTLTLRQDNKGLFYSCTLPETRTAMDIHESIRRGDISECSFAFKVPDGEQDWTEECSADGSYYVLRSIRSANVKDVSPVTYPAYGGTKVNVRGVQVPVELRSAVDSKNGVTPESRDWAREAGERWRQAGLKRCAEIEAEINRPIGSFLDSSL